MILVRKKCSICGEFIDVPVESAYRRNIYCAGCLRVKSKENWEFFKEFINFEAAWHKYYKRECREMFE